MLTIAKFGGSSLATAARFRAVKALIAADPARQGIVVSAPGRRAPEDSKLTDLLYAAHTLRQSGGDWLSPLGEIESRFSEIAQALSLPLDLSALKDGLRKNTLSRDAVASRGEYYCAALLARYLDRKLIDSADWLCFAPDGTVDAERSYAQLRRLADAPFVTPGFYGALNGEIKTLSRGGSDVTGALAAAALQADLYENWTDVPGVLTADPKIDPYAKPIPHLTYSELSALAEKGLQVLHEGAVRPVREKGIPMRIASSFQPELPGTWISGE